MEKKAERTLTRRIVRAVAAQLADTGFVLTKPTYATCAGRFVTPFFHFHKFSFAPAFCIHVGLRVMNDESDFISLNGPDEAHAGRFSEAESAVDDCIDQMAQYCRGVGLPWIARRNEPRRLLSVWRSPLDRAEKAALREALAGREVPEHVVQSEQLLGLRPRRDDGHAVPVV